MDGCVTQVALALVITTLKTSYLTPPNLLFKTCHHNPPLPESKKKTPMINLHKASLLVFI